LKVRNAITAAATLAVATILAGCGGSDSPLTDSPKNAPGSIAAHFVYVMNATSNTVSAYAINAQTGALIPVGNSPFAAGMQPSAMTIAPSGAYAYVSNAGSNDISGYSISASTGALTALSGSPYAVSPYTSPVGFSISPVAIDPSGKLAFVTNPSAPAGSLTHTQPNNFFVYTIDGTSGELQPAPGSPLSTGGIDPVSVGVDPSGKFVYVANNIPQVGSEGNSISAFSIDTANVSVAPIGGSPFLNPRQEAGKISLTIDPTGGFVYLNCQACGIAGYSIDAGSGGLTPVDLGNAPPEGLLQAQAFVTKGSNRYAYTVSLQNICAEQVNSSTGALTQVNCLSFAGSSSTALAVDALGSFVFVVDPALNNVSAFAINATSGALSTVTGSPFPTGAMPKGLAIDAKGSVVYVTNSGSNDISAYVVNRTTGALTAIPGSPFGAGAGPGTIVLL
jgi:6-phosphogluconolactonase